jgi:precorrin-8X/cobalt-precorrin-8 methylmutase
MHIHPIEEESYRILRARRDLSHLPPLRRAITERAVHATADLSYADEIHADEASLARTIEALRSGCAVITDVEMTRAGIAGYPTTCYLKRGVASDGVTRTANAMAQAIEDHRDNAIFVVGCAPTALFELINQFERGHFRPTLIIGLPVGFVGAKESKLALASSGAPSVYNVGEKGGSAVAAGVINALIRLAKEQ